MDQHMEENIAIGSLQWVGKATDTILTHQIEFEGVRYSYAANGFVLQCKTLHIEGDQLSTPPDLSASKAKLNMIDVYIKQSGFYDVINDYSAIIWKKVDLPYANRPSVADITLLEKTQVEIVKKVDIGSKEYDVYILEEPMTKARFVRVEKDKKIVRLLRIETVETLVGLQVHQDMAHWQWTAEVTVRKRANTGTLLHIFNGDKQSIYIDLLTWRKKSPGQVVHTAPGRLVFISKRLTHVGNDIYQEEEENEGKIALKIITCTASSSAQLGFLRLSDLDFVDLHADNVAREVAILRQIEQEAVESNSSSMFTQLKHLFLLGATVDGELTRVYRLCLAFPCYRRLELPEVRQMNDLDSEAFARCVTSDILLALQFLHEKGYVHLDVTLENIMVNQDYKCILIDFGNARKFPPDETNVTIDVQTVGVKTSYRSPEVVQYNKDCLAINNSVSSNDPVSDELIKNCTSHLWTKKDCYTQDIWCLGVCLFKLLHRMFPVEAAMKYASQTVFNLAGNVVDTLTMVFVMNPDSVYRNLTFPDAQELLRGMLAAKKESRYEIDDVITHSWLSQEPSPEQRKSLLREDYAGQMTGNKRTSYEMTQTGATTATNLDSVQRKFSGIDFLEDDKRAGPL
ncbi:hypothetical protein EON65_26930 [archaeon]|nr:MAG: hypothetical protein EON65_26930 [archaeon]